MIVNHVCERTDSPALAYQYKRYGYGKVVANQSDDGPRCTVCGEVIGVIGKKKTVKKRFSFGNK